MSDLQRAARVGIWFTLAAIVLVFLFAACASAPPVRQLPPRDAWPACAAWCEAHDSVALGIILVDPEGQRFGCGCGARAPTTPLAWDGPT